tara:strand:+ start:12 stop:1079 length:1068 start_codon:yes stop_codon:yes gene_type:complete
MNKSMKIISLTKYSYKGASSRYRFYNFKYLFKKKNISYVVKPLLNNNYLEDLYLNKKKNIFNIFFCYVSRIFILFTLGQYNKIIIEKELLPYIPLIEYFFFKIYKSKIYLDYDDYVFDNYKFKFSITRKLFKNKFKFILTNSKGVIVGNNFLKKYVIQYNKNVKVIPTLVNINNYKNIYLQKNKIISIVWIGTPTTIKYLEDLIPALISLRKNLNFNLIIVGGKLKNNLSFVKYLDWSEETEVKILRSCHIGIMPLDNSTWSKGKCGLKILQYMAASLPVVVSATGANKDIVSHDFDGFLANDHKQWIEYLTELINNDLLREKLGYNGYKKVINYYSYENNFPKLLSFLEINADS